MRYLLLLHGNDSELHTPEWSQEAAAFIARFDDALASRSELEWSEVLAPASRATVFSPGGDVLTGPDPADADVDGTPVSRVWVVRVADEARATALGQELAEALGLRVEVRECLPSSQKP